MTTTNPAQTHATGNATKRKRKRWDPEAHKKWMKKVWGNKMFSNSEKLLAADRADRKFTYQKIKPVTKRPIYE